MTSSSSLYGSSTTTGTVASGNYTTLYSTGTGTVPNNNLVVPGTLTINGCAILTNCSTFDILPTTVATVNLATGSTTTALNLGTQATSVSIGGPTGFTLVNNQLTTANYAFPIADGNANEVLTTDGLGNVYWALPGGGGSTFGNVSVGVVTDNTISTTTGDLDVTSDTGVVNINSYTTLTDGRLTTTSVSTVTLDSFDMATYQTATYFINVKDTVTGDIHSTKIDIMHDGTTAYINQYSNMYSTADLSIFATTVSGTDVLLEITPASTNSTQFTFSRTAIRV